MLENATKAWHSLEVHNEKNAGRYEIKLNLTERQHQRGRRGGGGVGIQSMWEE